MKTRKKGTKLEAKNQIQFEVNTIRGRKRRRERERERYLAKEAKTDQNKLFFFCPHNGKEIIFERGFRQKKKKEDEVRFTVYPVVQVDFPSGGLSSGPPGGSSQLERRLPPMENRVVLFSRLEDSNVSVPRPDNDGRRDPGLPGQCHDDFHGSARLARGPGLHLVGSTRHLVVLNSFDNDARGSKRGKTRSGRARCGRAQKRRWPGRRGPKRNRYNMW